MQSRLASQDKVRRRLSNAVVGRDRSSLDSLLKQAAEIELVTEGPEGSETEDGLIVSRAHALANELQNVRRQLALAIEHNNVDELLRAVAAARVHNEDQQEDVLFGEAELKLSLARKLQADLASAMDARDLTSVDLLLTTLQNSKLSGGEVEQQVSEARNLSRHLHAVVNALHDSARGSRQLSTLDAALAQAAELRFQSQDVSAAIEF